MTLTKKCIEKFAQLSKINLDINDNFIKNFQSAINIIDKIKSFDLNTEKINNNSYLQNHAIPLQQLSNPLPENTELLKKMPYIETSSQDEKFFYVPKVIKKEEK